MFHRRSIRVVSALALGWLIINGPLFPAVAATGWAQDRQATSPESIRARPGFVVELLRSAQATESSWISLTFDPQGRVLLGLDDFGIGRLTFAAATPEVTFERLPGTESLRHVRGVLYAHNALYVSATDSQGLYRLPDLGDRFADPQLLQELSYQSRYGHGTNQITLGPDGMLYFVVGNDVVLPPRRSENSPYRQPKNDWLLPYRHDAGHDDRVGYIVKVDPAGETWEVIAGGFRNQVDVAFNQDGEMFTWDADMEWDVGLPWYRPTRLNHVVAGGEYGWRWGTGKWPDWYPDSLPTTLDTGLGSPTGLVFGHTSNWPAPYQSALFMADWQFGRILIVDLQPVGASYQATAEWFIEGGPLNVCDLTFGPDGALYFITGGRGSQSGLYRVRWTETSAPATRPRPTRDVAHAALEPLAARRLRQQLEHDQRHVDPAAIERIWPQLSSHDPWLRFAARVALEHQPLPVWRSRLATAEPDAGLPTALLALARVGGTEDQALLLDRWLATVPESAAPEHWILPLRTLQLSWIRQGPPPEAYQERLLAVLDPQFPHPDFAVNRLLQELLVKLRAPNLVGRSLQLIEAAPTQEEQLQYAKTLTHVDWDWDHAAALRTVAWLAQRRSLTGGHLAATAWQNLKADFQQLWNESLQQSIAAAWAALEHPLPATEPLATSPRPFVRRWTVDELLAELGTQPATDQASESSQGLLAAATCLQCHRFGQRGTPLGPDLTDVGKRFDTRLLLESILEPSKQIDPKYALSSFLLQDGRVISGRTTGVSQTQLTLEISALSGQTVVIERAEIEQSLAAAQSPMPAGLLDNFTSDEIRQIITLLRHGP